LDAISGKETSRIKTANGPGMTIFSPDGKYAYVCSSFNPETVVVTVADHQIAARLKQDSPFCPNIAVTPDGAQLWFTLKDVGEVMAFNARPPFNLLKTIATGPITNHVNFARNRLGSFAYVSVGGRNEVRVFRTSDFGLVKTIPVGKLPHGIWPSGDGTRVYVGLENDDALVAIDTLTNEPIATIPIGQAPQAVVYVPNAVTRGDGSSGLEPLGVAGRTLHLTLAQASRPMAADRPTSVALFDQGLVQVIQAAVSGLAPKTPHVLALSERARGDGKLEPLAVFTTNPAGAALVNAVGPIRQLVRSQVEAQRRYLVIAAGTPDKLGPVVQVQAP
ncbi:MAG TPA: YncE family protein, partial [Polyangiales bacterium]